MKVFYYKSQKGNFGDDLNGWLWDSLLPDFFDDNPDVMVSGIGTIIDSYMPKAKNWFVFSSGVGYGFPPSHFGDSNWDTLCVRGPLSANILGLPKNKFITDGAAFINGVDGFEPLPESEREGVIFIPHHYAIGVGNWEKACVSAGIEFVNPEWESKFVIQKIRKAKLVIADAMHAAIIADALRVPWVPVITSPQINTFKWLDWTSTIDTPYKPIVLGSSTLKECVRSKGLAFYGEKYFNENTADIEFAIKKFRKQREIKSTSYWKHYRKGASLMFNRIPRTVASVLSKGVPSIDQRLNDQCVNILINAKNQTGYLSNDAVFYRNLDRLHECLNELKTKGSHL